MAQKVHYEVVTPNGLLVSGEADMVVAPGGDGDFGVLPDHMPMLSTLRPGTVDVYEDSKVCERIFVEGGFAEVAAERCVLLAQEAHILAHITMGEAEGRFLKAQNALEAAGSFDLRKTAGRELDTASAMLAAVKEEEERRRRR